MHTPVRWISSSVASSVARLVTVRSVWRASGSVLQIFSRCSTRQEREDGLAAGGGVQRAAVADPGGVPDDLLALDLVDVHDGQAVTGQRAEEDRLAGATHQLDEGGPGHLGQIAASRRRAAELEDAQAEAIVAVAALREVAARGEGAQQREAGCSWAPPAARSPRAGPALHGWPRPARECRRSGWRPDEAVPP